MFMELIKNSSRFNLIQFFSGGARRHPPLRSVFTFLFVFLFSLHLCSVQYVSATVLPFVPSVPFAPYANPATKDQYDRLIESERKIVDFLVGIVGDAYAGYTGYNFQNSFTGTSFRDKAVSFGNMICDKFFGAVLNPGVALNSLANYITSSIAYAQNVPDDVSFEEWYSDDVAAAGSDFSVFYPSDLSQDFINLFYPSSVYDSQFLELSWDQLYPYSWVSRQASEVQESSYLNYLSQYSYSFYFNTPWASSFNGRFCLPESSSVVLNYRILFFNTSTHKAYFVDNSGNAFPDTFYDFGLLYCYNSNVVNNSGGIYAFKFISAAIPPQLTSWDAIVSYFLGSGSLNLFSFPNGNLGSYYGIDSIDLTRFVSLIYYGADWASRQSILPIDDLNFADNTTDKISAQVPSVDTGLKVTDYVDDVVAGETDTRTLVIDNSVVAEDSLPLTVADLKSITINPTLPESGIVIPDGLFSPLTVEGGVIDYLWYMTKPLVRFSRSVLDILIFDGFSAPDPVTGQIVSYSASGPGMIVLGVVGIGLIGGLVVKCLL